MGSSVLLLYFEVLNGLFWAWTSLGSSVTEWMAHPSVHICWSIATDGWRDLLDRSSNKLSVVNWWRMSKLCCQNLLSNLFTKRSSVTCNESFDNKKRKFVTWLWFIYFKNGHIFFCHQNKIDVCFLRCTLNLDRIHLSFMCWLRVVNNVLFFIFFMSMWHLIYFFFLILNNHKK